jgi:hypothetical protein
MRTILFFFIKNSFTSLDGFFNILSNQNKHRKSTKIGKKYTADMTNKPKVVHLEKTFKKE